jgi:hypothetical protein
MPTRRITAAAIEAMSSGTVLWDSEVRGFGVRYRGRDRIYLVKTRIKGRQRVLTIGRDGRGYWRPETARREAIRLLWLIRNGTDPASERDHEKAAPDLVAFADRYLAEYARPHKKVRTVTEDERLLRLHWGAARSATSAGPKWHGSITACEPRPSAQTARWRCCPPSSAGRRR